MSVQRWTAAAGAAAIVLGASAIAAGAQEQPPAPGPNAPGAASPATSSTPLRVMVLGAVSRPGHVEVKEGDRLSMALARAGADVASNADLSRVYLTRTDPATGKPVSFQINLFQALQRGDQRYDPILRKDDKVFVPEARGAAAPRQLAR